MPTVIAMTMILSVQPISLPILKANTSAERPIKLKSDPVTSKEGMAGTWYRRRSGGKFFMAMIKAKNPTGILMRKIQRQEKKPVMRPPSGAPTIMPRELAREQIPKAQPTIFLGR